jgi:aminopeptidase N
MITSSTFRIVLAGAFTLAAVVPVFADAPFSFDHAYGRLPKNVVPLAYRVAIVPNATARTLTGTESVTVDVRSATPTIEFNSLNEKLTNVRLDGMRVARVDTSDPKQLTIVTLPAPAKPGRHTLSFAYTGKIETGPDGLFAQPYRKPDGTAGLMLSTQFEATDARRMFPCWDEPAFRATFQLTATVPAAFATVSNMPVMRKTVHGALATTTFYPSPKMPSYLVEFSAGDLARISADHDGTNFGVWAVKGQEQDGQVALANAQTILADYNDYFGVKFPLPKLDSIAVPGGFQGAMENWGAITYNDQALLITPSSTVGDKQNVFSIQAHEMAHQWNGDLVTMGWWDDLWLNESFASWRSAKETDMRNPNWNWWEDQDGDKESAMRADARITSHPIQVHITDELQAETAFDSEITYAKGQAFLRMLEAYLGPDTFRDGVRRYMQARKFSNATAADLWNALGAASGKDVAELSSTWIKKPGFPLVSVAATCDASGNRTIALTQKRFLLQGTDPSNTQWSIPLDIRSGANGTPVQVLLTQNGQTSPAGNCSEPLSVNAGTVGFYRVAYDEPTFAVNAKAFGTLQNADRIALLDDQWALAQSGAGRLADYMTLARSMGDDLDTRAWTQITDSLEAIESDERGTPGYDAYVRLASSIIEPVYDKLGWDAKPDETPGIQRLRRYVIGDLGAWGDPRVIAEARKRFAAFVADRSSIRPDDQSTILSIVAEHADAATFDQLHAIAKSSKNETEMRRYYGALMLVRDEALAREAVQIALSPEIPQQAAPVRLGFIAAVGEYNPKLSWTTMQQNVSTLFAPFGPMEAPQILAQYIPQGYWRAVPLDDLETWVKAHIPAEMAPNLARGMESARFDVVQKTALDTAADAYVSVQDQDRGNFRTAPLPKGGASN